MNLEKLNVVELNAQEVQETEGGTVPSWLKKLGWGYVASVVVDNWSDIKSGFSDGWNDAK